MRMGIHIERLRLKADIINWLGWQAGYRSYLEIATPFTGFKFSLIAPDVSPTIGWSISRHPTSTTDSRSPAWDHRPTVRSASAGSWINGKRSI
jgi:hypothetical protein